MSHLEPRIVTEQHFAREIAEHLAKLIGHDLKIIITEIRKMAATIDDLNAKLDEANTALAAAAKRDADSRAALQALLDAAKAGQDLSGPLAKAQALVDAANAIDPAPAPAPPAPTSAP